MPGVAKIHHRFLDETGDTTFYGKGRRVILGEEGVSRTFGLGIIKIDADLGTVRGDVRALQQQVVEDPLLNTIPSVIKRVRKGAFYFHACKDTPDVRDVFLRYLRELKCEAEVVVTRKIPALFERQHHALEEEFYADLLSHLIKRRMKRPGTLVLNVAERGRALGERSSRGHWKSPRIGPPNDGVSQAHSPAWSSMCKPP